MECFKEEIAKTNLISLVFCSEHDSSAKAIIVDEMSKKTFEEQLARLNYNLKSKDVLSGMVQERTRFAKAYEELVADILSEPFKPSA